MKNKTIITDPCYIMDRKDYQRICDEGGDFEGLKFPYKTKHRKTGENITIHIISSTPHGDGSYDFNDSDIGVDSGMLCIACKITKWREDFGATFNLLSQAKIYLPIILKKF